MRRFCLVSVGLCHMLGWAGAAGSQPLNPLQDLAKDALSGFRERPLFAPSRRPPPPKPQDAAAAPAIPAVPRSPPPTLRLVGVTGAAGFETALVRQGDHSRTTVLRSGERLGDWVVTILSGQVLRLSRDQESIDFRLFAPKVGPAPTQPTSPGLFTVPSPPPSPGIIARDNRLRSRSY